MNKKKRGLGAVLVGLGATAMTAVALSAGSLAGFTASISNNTDTAGTGFVVMQESNSDGSIVCTSNGNGSNNNSANCSTINKYGGNLKMVAGQSATTTVTIANTGNVAASTFSLAMGQCTSSAQSGVALTGTGNLCDQVTVTIKKGTTPVFSGTANSLAGQTATTLGPVAAGDTATFTITVTVGSIDNSYAGLQISQPMTWTFTA